MPSVDIDIQRLRELWARRDYTIAMIAENVGCSVSTVKKWAREHDFPAKSGHMRNANRKDRCTDPSPEEIAKMCAEIRRKSPKGNGSVHWEMPSYKYDNRTGVFS